MINKIKKEPKSGSFSLQKWKGEMHFMFKKSKILKKLGAGFMAGLCAFSMLGSSMSGVITANAASTSTENSAFPSADTVIAKAATLLGSPYTFGNKGYWYAYNQGQYTPLSVETINNLGIDCSGLVYYTLTQLGYKTSGFSWNNPVPVDTDHWLTVNDNCTITYDGKTSKVEVEKKNIKTTDRPGSVLTVRLLQQVLWWSLRIRVVRITLGYIWANSTAVQM